MRQLISRLSLFLAVLLPAQAYAHSMTEGTSFLGGFLHPLLGPDHLLAMLSVGIISALIGGLSIYLVPATFVTFMVIGGAMGVFGMFIPHVEFGIALSVVLLGAAIANPRLAPVWLTMCVVGFFGILHGYAHGVEMPRSDVPVFYSFGFIVCTTMVHIVGVGIGFVPWLHWKNRLPMNVSGIAFSVAGLYFLTMAAM